MRTVFYLDGKKITRKALKEIIGEEKLKRFLESAKELFFEDPYIANDYFCNGHIVSCEFK